MGEAPGSRDWTTGKVSALVILCSLAVGWMVRDYTVRSVREDVRREADLESTRVYVSGYCSGVEDVVTSATSLLVSEGPTYPDTDSAAFVASKDYLRYTILDAFRPLTEPAQVPSLQIAPDFEFRPPKLDGNGAPVWLSFDELHRLGPKPAYEAWCDHVASPTLQWETER